MILQHHETEPRMKRWDDCVDGQGQGKSLKLLQRWDDCVEGQGQGKSLKLLQMFVGSIFSGPLISWQPNYWCYGTVTNNQTKCKQSGWQPNYWFYGPVTNNQTNCKQSGCILTVTL